MSKHNKKFEFAGKMKILDKDGVGRDHFVYRNKQGIVKVYTSGGKTPNEDDLIYHTVDGITQSDRYDITYTKTMVEQAMLGDSQVSNQLNSTWWGYSKPDFVKDAEVNAGTFLEMSEVIKEQFKVVESDYFFTDATTKGERQYPIDALYDSKKPDSQDHLVISQYSYKAPRADDIWFNDQSTVVSLLTEGIGRSSPLDKFLGMVRLPMPNSIQDSNNVRWGEDSLNALEAAALKAVGNSPMDEIQAALLGVGAGAVTGIDAGAAAQGGVAIKVLNDVLSKLDTADKGVGSTILGTEATARILGALGIETSAEAILARRDGVVPNSNLELLFQAPTLRQFSFMYKMSPRSAEEAKAVNQIIRFFKQGMAAKKKNSAVGGFEGGRSYFLGTPNVFRLQYRTSGGRSIDGINRIKTCALTGTSVNYTPEGAFASYDGGQPVSVLLTLGFQELEPIYDTDYKTDEGTTIEGERKSDTDTGYRWRINKNEVGY